MFTNCCKTLQGHFGVIGIVLKSHVAITHIYIIVLVEINTGLPPFMPGLDGLKKRFQWFNSH
ncbi:MAG: hypothetical protein EPGJADBJ_04183 [Saprospiraceae bacterium]|nr:hypothetical protein [Saprospiraceae bacterium]